MPEATATPTTTDRLSEIVTVLGDESQVVALTDEDLVALRAEIRQIGAGLQAGEVESDDILASLSTCVDHVAGINYVLEGRAEVAAELATRMAELNEQLGSEPTDEPEPEAADEPEAALAAEPEVDADAETEPEPEAKKIAPKADKVKATAAAAVTPDAPALPTTAAMSASRPAEAAPAAGVATGGESRLIKNLQDHTYQNIDEFAQTVIEAHDELMDLFDPAREAESKPDKVRLGRFSRGDFPEERVLDGRTDRDNTKIMRVLNDAWTSQRWNEPEFAALTASGGFCAPAMPDYDIPIISGTQRPVHDYLPVFQADRGQVITIVPPGLPAVATTSGQTAGSAVSVWPNSVDTTPGATVKPFQTIPCPTNVTTAAEAIVEQLKIGNFEARAFPELVKTWMGLAAAAWARRAEGQLLADIHANVTSSVTTPQVLGATRDLLGYVSQAASLFRYRNRMPADAKLRVVFPALLADIIAADIVRQAPGDAGGDLSTTLAVTRAQVEAWFQAKDVTVTWYEDVSDSVSAAELARYAGAQGNTELKEFPLTIRWWLFHEGAFALLDAGTLDLGIVRDSTLDSTNDYKFFTESFENVIPHVIEAMEVASTVAAFGTAAALASDTSAYFGSAS